MKLLTHPDFDSRLPRTAAEREAEIDVLWDVICGNAELGDMREFTKAGVRLGHT